MNAEAVAEWCQSAAERRLIEATAGSTAVERWNITDAGGRFISNDLDAERSPDRDARRVASSAH